MYIRGGRRGQGAAEGPFTRICCLVNTYLGAVVMAGKSRAHSGSPPGLS
jgi:hypothetical protein